MKRRNNISADLPEVDQLKAELEREKICKTI